MKNNARKKKISELNDLLRVTFNWKVIVTKWILELSEEQRLLIMAAVITFDDFTEDNDPYGEHDFWAVIVMGLKIFWKIDYYSKENQSYWSKEPENPDVTERVLTIMRADEY